MSLLWHIRVEQLDGDTATLAVRRIHPDAGPFLAAPAFALGLLYDQALDVDARGEYVPLGPLGAEVGVDEVDDADAAAASAPRFIAAVWVTPEPGDDRLATYRITATDPRWLKHLHVGQEWDSASYA